MRSDQRLYSLGLYKNTQKRLSSISIQSAQHFIQHSLSIHGELSYRERGRGRVSGRIGRDSTQRIFETLSCFFRFLLMSNSIGRVSIVLKDVDEKIEETFSHKFPIHITALHIFVRVEKCVNG
jgi:hypothetical protein